MQGQLHPVDARAGHVVGLGLHVGEDDRVTQVGAVQRGFQAAAAGQLAAPLQLVALGMLGLELRIAVLRIVEIIQRWCAKAFAVGQQQVVALVYRQGQAGTQCGFAAELLVAVVAQAKFA
ncbi:hypothetical protein D3C76_1514300 [compost metagenome]